MNYYGFKDSKLTKGALTLFLLALLVLCRDTVVSAWVLGLYKAQFLSLGLVALVGAAFLWKNRTGWKKLITDRRILLGAVLAVVLLVPMVLKRDWQMMYFSILLCALIPVFLHFLGNIRTWSRYFLAVLCFLSLYSLISLYVLRPLTDSGLLRPPVVVNSMGREFYHYGLSFVSVVEVKNRNFGIFREPGVYQYFVILGLFLNNYIAGWEKGRSLWTVNTILALTMISTFATGGMIEMALLAGVLFFEKKWYKSKKSIFISLSVVAAIALFILGNMALKTPIYREIRDMVMKFSENPESTGARMGSIAVGVELFFRHPILGSGVAEVLHAITDNTSSTLILYGIYGFIGGSVNVLAWGALVWDQERHWFWNLALLVILFMAFNTQNLTWDTFFWLFPVMALAERGIPLIQSLRKAG